MIQNYASHHRAASSMQIFWQHLEDGSMEAGENVLRSLGYADKVIDYVLDPESYYFPVEKKGSLRLPKGYTDDKIPVVALRREQVFNLPQRYGLHPLQAKALATAGNSQDKITEIDDCFRAKRAAVETYGGRMATASVETLHCYESGENDAAYYRSRPTVVFAVEDLEPNKPHCPAATLHELTHVAQVLAQPTNFEDILTEELEAYAVEAALVGEEAFLGSSSLSMAITVDHFRKQNLGKSSFEVTPEFEAKILADRVLSRIV